MEPRADSAVGLHVHSNSRFSSATFGLHYPNEKTSKKGKKKELTEEELKEQAQLSMLTMDNDERPHFIFSLAIL